MNYESINKMNQGYAGTGYSVSLKNCTETPSATSCTTIRSQANFPDDKVYGGIGLKRKGLVTATEPVPEPVSQQEFEDKMAAKPLPDGVPQALPIPLPVEPPVVNPSADPEPTPQPLRVPMGEPQPVPNTSPQEYKTPVVDIVPSPTATDPWRVDLQPKDIVKTDPTPVPEGTPDTAPNTGEKAEEKTPGLCDLYPGILACAKPELDTPASDELEKKEVQVTLTPDSGWGGGGSCPAPRHLGGANVDFEFTMVCNFMSGIKPVVLAIAWLAAAFILLGFKGSND